MFQNYTCTFTKASQSFVACPVQQQNGDFRRRRRILRHHTLHLLLLITIFDRLCTVHLKAAILSLGVGISPISLDKGPVMCEHFRTKSLKFCIRVLLVLVLLLVVVLLLLVLLLFWYTVLGWPRTATAVLAEITYCLSGFWNKTIEFYILDCCFSDTN